ncbi:uncharacterized protein LOC129594438 [Paramacrobiotus metropolitanus]|uniref:uncharacterized protein LOC129594438 n=1 Tax=Paramacrobiotus metropolitanus TaxID=2943436 RepID=UPI0024461D03|nr:uncharacterized protein LOC129594438 [Paramacrobiotus metropolitanus]
MDKKYPILITGTLLFYCNVVLGQYQNAPNCRVPMVPPAVSIDPSQAAGVWYEYSAYTPGIIDYNCINVFTPLGAQNGMSAPYNWTISFLMKTPNPICVGICLVANVTADGKEAAAAWFPDFTGSGALPSRSDIQYYILYTDYHLLEVAYRCSQPSNAQFCDAPYFWVNVRVRPPTLDQATLNYIQRTVDNVLAPFCFANSNMTVTGWDSTLPDCQPPLSADCAALMQSTRQSSSFAATGNRMMDAMLKMRGQGFAPGGIGWPPA